MPERCRDFLCSTHGLADRGSVKSQQRFCSRPSKEEIVMAETLVNTMREEKIEGAAGKLLIRSLRPTGTTRGVVMIVPGFNAHSGYYGWAADQLVAIGLATYAVDLR